ncbi:MAG: Lrp/AsnC family transcriptional regulator [Oscillospiraceae bacterium]|jgi:Lrp/AsnC family leucine-responsive transcriptional regulator
MDEIDIKILKLLQENSRITISELSKKINLSRPSISERILRLQEQGIIEEFTSRISLKAIGRRILLFIEIEAMKTSPEILEEMLINEADILECHRVSGKTNYIVKAAVDSIEGMTDLINRLIPYGSLCTSVVLSSPVPYRHVLPNTKIDQTYTY